MNFLNPWLLLGVLGVALPILAHLLNRYQVKRTEWAAMRFLDRSVRIRSRQLKLRDILLLIMRCLALLFIVLALARPTTKGADGLLSGLGEKRAGVIIALDGSFSMQHAAPGSPTRLAAALERIDAIRQEIRPGDPVTLVVLGDEHRVVMRNAAYVPAKFEAVLGALELTAGAMDMDSVPRCLKELADEMKAAQKEIYIVTDLQAQDWTPRSPWLVESFRDLSRSAMVCVVPVGGGSENLAITGLELMSGVLRKGTSARYRVTVRNFGKAVAEQVKVTGLINNISADTKVIPAIAPGATETVSLFFMFRDPGPVRIAAELDQDGLQADNARRAVVVIRDRVNVLCVEGATETGRGPGNLISAALQAKGGGKSDEDIAVQTVSWVGLPGQDLRKFDVVILADVPEITAEQSELFDRFVREGNGLIWFGGESVKERAWNRKSGKGGPSWLPASLEGKARTSDAMGVGRPLDPSLTDHPVCRPLRSLPGDLLGETRFHTLLRVKPAPSSVTVLSLAGSDLPVLLESTLGRGHIFMFTTSAGTVWNNMAVSPVFPMLLQQMVTYLTAREFETPRVVGESLSLSYIDQPDAPDAVFEAPSGAALTVPVRDYQDQHVALLPKAREAGFYQARVSLQAAGMPVAVNVDTRESAVQGLTPRDAEQQLKGSGIRIAASAGEVMAIAEESKTSRSLWFPFLLAGLALLVIESLLAVWLTRTKGAGAHSSGEPSP
jgi:hypothetical protein